MVEDEYDTEKVLVPDVGPRERRATSFESASDDNSNGTVFTGSGEGKNWKMIITYRYRLIKLPFRQI
jgi:hypothetical protein